MFVCGYKIFCFNFSVLYVIKMLENYKFLVKRKSVYKKMY